MTVSRIKNDIISGVRSVWSRTLGARVNRAAWRREAAGHRTDVDDAGAFAEVFDGCLRGEQKTEHVNVKHLVELFFGDGLDGGELIHAGVVNEDVEAAIVFDCGVDDALGLSSLGDVAPHGNSLATGCGDVGDNSLRPSLAGSIVHYYSLLPLIRGFA